MAKLRSEPQLLRGRLGDARPSRARRLVRVISLAFVGWGCASGCSALLRSDDASFAQHADAAADARHEPATDSHRDASIDANHDASDTTPGAAAFCKRDAETRLQADVPRIGALLGAAMAADGDVLVATAPFEPEDATENLITRTPDCSTNVKHIPSSGKGSAYVFERTTSGWHQQRLVIKGGDLVEAQVPEKALWGLPDEGIYPTYSVAVSGDTIAFGIGGDGARAPYRGSVRLFQREPNGWKEAALPIEQPTSKTQDLFGMSVALLENTLVVGAPSEDRALDGGIFDGAAGDGGPRSDRVLDGGAVYVYELDGTRISHTTRLVPSSTLPLAYFGYSVALTPEWVAVGAPGEDPDGVHVLYGNVYVYRRSASGVETTPQVLKMPERRTMGTAGTSLALRGDTLIVGSPTSAGCNPPVQPTAIPGAVHIFKLLDGEWTYQQCFDGSRAPGAAFAYKVALGTRTLLVGAPLETLDFAKYSAGTVYEYRRSNGPFERAPCIVTAPEPMSCGAFGLSLALTDSFAAVSASYEGSLADSSSLPLDSGGIYTYRPSEPP